MSRSTLKLALQIIGALVGLFGTSVVSTGIAVVIVTVSAKKDFSAIPLLFAALAIAIGAYCLWIAYISIRKFGPLAVLHITGAAAVFLFSLPRSFLPEPRESLWINLLFFVWLLVIALGYRRVSQRLNRILFAPEHPYIPASAPMPPARAPIPE